MKEVKLDKRIVKYNDDEEVKNKVFNALIEWYIKHEAFSGESIIQSDNPTIDAPNILSDIADDIIKFDIEWKD